MTPPMIAQTGMNSLADVLARVLPFGLVQSQCGALSKRTLALLMTIRKRPRHDSVGSRWLCFAVAIMLIYR